MSWHYIFILSKITALMRVLILGGGYGGIFTAANMCNNDEIEVTLVNDGPNHQLLQKIHRVASGELHSSDITFDISDALGKDVRYVQGKCEKVDLIKKVAEITTKSEVLETIQFDYLIIAIGAKNEYFGVKGAKENALSLRSVNDSIAIYTAIKELPPDSIVTIAGGGATGISLAGALSDKLGKKIKIRIIESQKEILPGWESIIVEMVKEYLRNENVEILTGKSIKEIGSKNITLSTGDVLQTDVTIWTAGIRGQDLVINPEVERTISGRIVVDEFSRVSRLDGRVFVDVFAIGDVSAFSLDGNGKLSPQLAQFAVRQARNVAKNILARENGGDMIKLEYVQKGQIISLGTNCVGTLNGIPISGCICENTEDFIIDNYIKAILNRGKGLEGMVYDRNSLRTELAMSINFFSYLCRKSMMLS